MQYLYLTWIKLLKGVNMEESTEKVNVALEAFAVFSTQLGDDDIYKRILIEVLFEELMRNKGDKNGK